MTKDNITPFIKRFAFRDSLLRIVGLIGSTFTIAAVSLLPGFGVKGLMIASSIQVFLSAALEFPTSLLADRFGRSRILRLSLTLKLFVTVALFFSIFNASQGNKNLVWLFFVMEAALDALANPLLNGAYQVSYLSLYESVQEETKAPPLFLESFKYSIKFRLLFPILFSLFVIGIFSFFKSNSSNLYLSAYIVLSLIFLARLWLLYLVSGDFSSSKNLKDKSSYKIKHGLKEVFNSIAEHRVTFTFYALTHFINLFCIFYLTGKAMKLLPVLNLNAHSIWVSAISTFVCIYIVRTLISIYLLPKLTGRALATLKPIFGLIFLTEGLALFGLKTIFDSPSAQFFFYTFFIALAYTISDSISKSIESSLRDILKHDYKSSWLSMGSTSAYILYGIFASSLLLASPELENTIAGLTFGLCGFFIFYLQLKNSAADGLPSFNDLFRQQLLNKITIVVLIFIAADFFNYFYTTGKKVNETRLSISTTIKLGVKSSLLQGNSVEALNFLHSLKTGSFIKCYSLETGANKIDNCFDESISKVGLSENKIKIENDGSNFGAIHFYLDESGFTKNLYTRLLADLVLGLFLYAFFFYLFGLIMTIFSNEILGLSSAFKNNETQATEKKFKIREFSEIHNELKTSFEIKNELNVKSALFNMASQVSHDIRSPLTALKMAIDEIQSLPVSQKSLITSSVQRINDIANDLLNTGKVNNHTIDKQVEYIAPIVDSLISEKRIQLRKRNQINIEVNVKEAYGLFSEVNSSELKRVLSNIINNCAEAIDSKGTIKVHLFEEKENLSITVSDNGKGIPPSVLEKLGTKGFSYGKMATDAGSGLGLFHAFATIRSFGGHLTVESKEAEGTTVKIVLPKAPAPEWFAEFIPVSPETMFYILDDDDSIHKLWSERLQDNLFCFTDAFDFTQALKENNSNKVFCLVDYELLDQKLNGLDLIETLNISNCSFLVTSHYEEAHVREKAKNLGVKIIPKTMMSSIPLKIQSSGIYQYVYIEDDPYLRTGWERRAKKKNIKLLTLKSTGDFENFSPLIDKESTMIYVDNELGPGEMPGEDFAKILFELGYKNIYMASGHSAEQFAHLSWLKFSGKDCPF